MARAVQFTIAAPNTTSVAASQTLAASASVVLNGSLATPAFVPFVVLGDDIERPLSITSTGNLSGLTFTAYFTNVQGQTTTGTITGPNNTTVQSTFNVNRLNRVTASGAVNTAFTLGTGAGGQTRWYTPSSYSVPFNIGIGAQVTNTVTYTVQHTFDDVQSNASPAVFNHASMNATTTSQDGYYAFNMRSTRGVVNTASPGALTLTYIQAGT